MKLLPFIFILYFSILFQTSEITAQTTTMSASDIPYSEIPDYPQSYEAGNVLARMVDGLGYRYYWATEGLTPKDLSYQPSSDAQSLMQTIDHVYDLSDFILNIIKRQPIKRPGKDISNLTFEEKRLMTLENFKTISELLKNSTVEDFETYEIVFQRGDTESKFPFWHTINGPIADAIYHTGQIVSFRRTTGNPLHSGVNVFTGKTKGK